MIEYKKIFICSDFLMTSDHEQLSNLPWLYDLLKRPIYSATGIKIEKFNSKSIDGFSRNTFFTLSDIELDNTATQFHYYPDRIKEESIKYLKKFITDSIFLIGYEFSEQTRELLTKYNINYIDIWLHPIRFMDDILFAFSSNNKAIFSKLATYDIPEDFYYLYADRFKISTYKGFKRHNLKLKDTSVLVVGQTVEDKAVLHDGKMLNILDFKDKLEELVNEFNTVYYSRHPYAKNDEKVMEYIRNHSGIEVIDIPAYILIAKEEIKKVVAISSSVVLEAKYFDKEIDFFYKPIFRLSNKFSYNSYISIMQSFVNPKFWSDIFSPIMEVSDCSNVYFFDSKDKVRDMLGFYWNYKIIDKTEHMRNQLNAVDRRGQKLENSIQIKKNKVYKTNDTNKKWIESPSKIINMEKKWAEIKTIVDGCEIVSFDVFDTLLVRPFENPSDLFELMEESVFKISKGIIYQDFKKIRIESRTWVENRSCGEEVSLQERYDAIAKKLNIKKSIMNKIMQLELDLELELLKKRDFVFKIFEYAKKSGKYIIIITDTFFDRKFIQEVLQKNEITGFDKLYISSEVGLLKHTGNLFQYIISELAIDPEKVIHIGDNIHSDIKQAEKKNLKTLYIPRSAEYFKEKSGLDKALSFNDLMTSRIIKGIISNKLMDNPLVYNTPSHCSGNQKMLGYSILGPMFFAFAKWILQDAKQSGLKDIYFLARDGEIVKRCYDILSKNDKSAPQSHYLYVSRRALSVPSIENEDDLIELSKINFSTTTIKALLINRFGINVDKISKKSLIKHGFKSINDTINSNTIKDQFTNLLLDNKSIFIEQANIEKTLLLEYLSLNGLNESIVTAIVDIGHNGTLQKRLSILLNNKNIGGYYFVTHSEIETNIFKRGMNAKSFVGEKINARDKRYPYNEFILMFETTFLNKDGSLIHFSKNKNDEIIPETLSVKSETCRLEFTNNIHTGILEFVNDSFYYEKILQYQLKIDGRESINPYIALLRYPFELDVLMFNKVNFENIYSGRNHRYLIDYNPRNYKKSINNSLWRVGIENCFFTKNRSSQHDRFHQKIKRNIIKILKKIVRIYRLLKNA